MVSDKSMVSKIKSRKEIAHVAYQVHSIQISFKSIVVKILKHISSQSLLQKDLFVSPGLQSSILTTTDYTIILQILYQNPETLILGKKSCNH